MFNYNNIIIMEYVDFETFQDEYLSFKIHLKKLRQDLFDVDDCEKRAEILSRIDTANSQMRNLQWKFRRAFPDVSQILDNGSTFENFEKMLLVLLKNSELSVGIELNILKMIQDIGRYPQLWREQFYPFLHKQFLSLLGVLSSVEMVKFCFENVDSDTYFIEDFVRWLASEMFSCEAEAQIKKFFASVCALADGKNCSLQQKHLLDICID